MPLGIAPLHPLARRRAVKRATSGSASSLLFMSSRCVGDPEGVLAFSSKPRISVTPLEGSAS